MRLNADFLKHKEQFQAKAKKILFTGTIDSYFEYRFGELEYRSLKFEEEILEIPNYQGVAVVNFTDEQTPYTRIIEHKHFEFGTQEKTIISKEYPQTWDKSKEPYYPINDSKIKHFLQNIKNLLSKSRISSLAEDLAHINTMICKMSSKQL